MLRLSAILLVISVGADSARADRAPSPTDRLGAWAIEGTLSFWGGPDDRLLMTGDEPSRVEELEHAYLGAKLRVWPATGLYVGLQQYWGSLDHDLREISELGGKEIGFADLRGETGYVGRLTPSLVVGGGARLELPIGNDVHSRERTDLLAHLLLGFSFTPRWDFYVKPMAATRYGNEGDPWGGQRFGFAAGFAYQRPRFFVLFEGFNLSHFEKVDYLSSGASFSFGWELTEGLTLDISLAGGSTERHTATPDIGRRSYERIGVIYRLTWVYYPDGRDQRLRSVDIERGRDWRWWNPPQGPR